MKPRATHTEFRKGTPVFVRMRDGSQITDVFQEKKSGAVILKDKGRVRLSAVQSISINRPSDT